MSGLYNLMFPGSLERAAVVCALLSPKLDYRSVDRIRDGLLDRDRLSGDPVFLLVTRTGGPNRVDYVESNERLQYHPNYVYDEDWDLDTTYALFHFNFPDDMDSEVRTKLTENAPDEPIDLTERFNEMIAQINP